MSKRVKSVGFAMSIFSKMDAGFVQSRDLNDFDISNLVKTIPKSQFNYWS